MPYMTEHEVMYKLTIEKNRITSERNDAYEAIGDMIDTIEKQILSIARNNINECCSCCLFSALALFMLMEKYALPERTANIKQQWQDITGMSIDDWKDGK